MLQSAFCSPHSNTPISPGHHTRSVAHQRPVRGADFLWCSMARTKRRKSLHRPPLVCSLHRWSSVRRALSRRVVGHPTSNFYHFLVVIALPNRTKYDLVPLESTPKRLELSAIYPRSCPNGWQTRLHPSVLSFPCMQTA